MLLLESTAGLTVVNRPRLRWHEPPSPYRHLHGNLLSGQCHLPHQHAWSHLRSMALPGGPESTWQLLMSWGDDDQLLVQLTCSLPCWNLRIPDPQSPHGTSTGVGHSSGDGGFNLAALPRRPCPLSA